LKALETEEKEQAREEAEAQAAGKLDARPPSPEKTPVPARSAPQIPQKVHGLLEQEDEEEEPPGETKGPGEPAPKIAPVVVTKEEPLPTPVPQPQAPPPIKPSAPAGLSDAERLRLLEDRFLRGEITELTYRELRERMGKK